MTVFVRVKYFVKTGILWNARREFWRK